MAVPSSPFSSDSLAGKLQRRAPDGDVARAFLLVVEGPRAGRLHLLGDQDMLIGRGDGVDIEISDPAVSHEHAQIIRRRDGYYVIDLDSRNGTLLNGVLISERRLRKRDRIQIGETSLVFLEEGTAEATLTVAVERSDQTMPIATVSSNVRMGGRAIPLQQPLQPVANDENPIFELVRKIVLLWGFVRRNVWAFATLPLLGLGLGAYSMRLLPPSEMAQAAVKLTQVQQKNPMGWGTTYDPRRDPPPFFAEPERNFANLELVAKALLVMNVEVDEGTVNRAFGGLSIARNPQAATGVYVASFAQAVKPPPEFSSVDFLERYLDAYLAYEVDKSIRVLTSEASFMESELQKVETELRDIENELLAVRNKFVDSSVIADRGSLAQQRAQYQIEVERARVEVSNLRKQLQQADGAVPIRSAELIQLRQELSAKERKLSELKAQGLRADHPEVRQLRSEVSTLQRDIERMQHSKVSDLERGTDPNIQALSAELLRQEGQLRVAESALSTINGQLAGASAQAKRLPEAEVSIQRLVRRQESLQSLRTQLFGKHREKLVQIELETANVRSRYEIVSPAQMLNPITRNFLIKHLGGGLGVGLALALTLAGFLEMRRLLRRHPELLQTGTELARRRG